MINVGDHVSWTHVTGRRTLTMSLREGVVENISTEKEPHDWFHDRLINMDNRELVIRVTTMHDDDIDYDYLVVARSRNEDDLDIPVYPGSKQECERHVDECSPYATIKKKRGRERIAVARLRVKGQKSQISELVEIMVETNRD